MRGLFRSYQWPLSIDRRHNVEILVDVCSARVSGLEVSNTAALAKGVATLIAIRLQRNSQMPLAIPQVTNHEPESK